MLPFPIINQYGNIAPVKGIKKFDTTYGNMYILFKDGRLYGLGRNGIYQLGTGDNKNQTTWVLIGTGISDFWISHTGDSPVLCKKYNGTWHLTGRAWIFGDNTTIYSTLTDITDKVGILNNGYDELYFNLTNLWYKKDGRYFRCGLNSNYNLLTGNTTSLSTLTEYIPDSTVKNIFPGGTGTIVTYTDGTVKSIGNNNSALYGLPNLSQYTSLTAITIPEVLSVYYSSNCTFFKTVSGLYACGNCYNGQLGNGITDINTKVNTPIKLFNTNPTYLVNSQGSTMCIVNGSVYFSGVLLRSGTGNSSTSTFIIITSIPNPTTYALNDYAGYYVTNDSLYGVGQPGFYSVLPNYTGTLLSFTKLAIPY